ncbi:MAG: NAD+ synthase [Alphaproteobacteria bacterium]|nr:NAD+ synthase [Alphaproteobacteria bacterium]
MTYSLKIRIVQCNPVVGDLSGNYARAMTALKKAEADGIDIVLFSEMFMTGYPPEDLLLKDYFMKDAMSMTRRLVKETADMSVAFVMSLPVLKDGYRYNAAWFIHKGNILGEYFKTELPNYGVFDEKRVFDSSPCFGNHIVFKGVKIGVAICEDIWHDRIPLKWGKREIDLMLSPNASPYARSKPKERLKVIWNASKNAGAPIVYCNQAGGQDELVFDGRSCAVNPTRAFRYAVQGLSNAWTDDETDYVFAKGKIRPVQKRPIKLWSEEADDYMGAVVGLRDYVGKSGLQGVTFGSSGGIDSALVAAMAVDAVGADNVSALMLPSPYSSEGSLTDAIQLAANLGMRHNYAVKIGGAYERMQGQMSELLKEGWKLPFGGVGDENLQPRLRMNYINALANELSENGIPTMALSTGNKSELAMGYFTAGGDGFGFYNPIKDLYKMRVYALSNWRNSAEAHAIFGSSGERIPQAIIDKEPSAELKPDQQDSDSLPPYPVLDDILERIMEKGENPVCVARDPKHDFGIVKWVYTRLMAMEFKRRLGPLGPILSRYAFDRERRLPRVNGYNCFDYVQAA